MGPFQVLLIRSVVMLGIVLHGSFYCTLALGKRWLEAAGKRGIPAIVYEAGEPMRFNQKAIALGEPEGVKLAWRPQNRVEVVSGQPREALAKAIAEEGYVVAA